MDRPAACACGEVGSECPVLRGGSVVEWDMVGDRAPSHCSSAGSTLRLCLCRMLGLVEAVSTTGRPRVLPTSWPWLTYRS